VSTTIRWLHLTDLHVGMNDQDWLWPKVQSKFRDDLTKIYDTAGPWDLVLFTGDLVQKGAEYAKLDQIFDEIWSWFADLGCDPKLLTVPGNHDLKWQKPADPVVKHLYRWETDIRGPRRHSGIRRTAHTASP
jgi:3',5'-cyclic AMP phosphodiesterase CpdA